MQGDVDTFPALLAAFRERLRTLDVLAGCALDTHDAQQIADALVCMDDLAIYWSAVRRRFVLRWRDVQEKREIHIRGDGGKP